MKKIMVICLIVLLIMSGCSEKNDNSDKKYNLSVHFIDVGQGDSTLILADKKTILIDAGDNSSGDVVTSYLKSLKIDTIDFLIATHPDADHIGGIDTVLYDFKVKTLIMPKKTHTTQTFQDVLLAAKERKVPITEGKYGMNFKISKDIGFEILNPSKTYSDDNNLWSIVIKLIDKNKNFLFMADAELENIKDMINKPINLDSDLLKLGHHGSYTSTNDNLLDKVSPDVAVVSCKYKNKYNHPHKEVLALLKKHNIPLYRTDEQGDIVFYSDGYEIWTDKKPATYSNYGGV